MSDITHSSSSPFPVLSFLRFTRFPLLFASSSFSALAPRRTMTYRELIILFHYFSNKGERAKQEDEYFCFQLA